MKRTHQGLLALVGCILLGTGVYLVHYVLSNKKVVAEPVEHVMIPDVLTRYTEQIQQADKILAEQADRMRDASPVTLHNLHGFFDLPLKQRIVPSQVRVPGDPRDYRKGVHQGIDFYDTRRGDPIYAAAPGVIIRIDKEYQSVERKFRDELLRLCAAKWNGTPGSVGMRPVEEPYGDVLDKLRGRQIIIYHGKNAQNEAIISLYAHTLDVNAELSVYDVVDTTTLIGHIGNSGTSGEVENNVKKENHLHVELFVGGMYWTPKQTSEIGIRQAAARYGELQQMILKELAEGYEPPGDQPESLSADVSPQR